MATIPPESDPLTICDPHHHQSSLIQSSKMALTCTPVAQGNSKTTEFARLFELFDRVATRRTRALTGDTSEIISADDIANVPADFVPVLKNLSTILSLRALRDEEHAQRAKTVSMTKARINEPIADAPSMTVTTKEQRPLSNVEESSKEIKVEPKDPVFPCRKRYPFTFKLMLHKLYDLDEWAEKVKDAVEASRSRFKPLAEQYQNAIDLDVSAGTKETVEKRLSGICPTLDPLTKFKSPSTTHLHPITVPFRPETSRVLKKRCIGRRKSINGPMSSSAWVYDAVISAVDTTSTHQAVEITLSATRDPGVDKRVRHYSLTVAEETHAKAVGKHKIKIAVPILQEASELAPQPNQSLLPLANPMQKVVGTGRTVR